MLIILLALTIAIYMGVMYLKKLKFLKINYIAIVINLVIYVLLYNRYGLTAKWIQVMFLFTILAILSTIDFKYKIIPNKIIAIIFIFGIMFNIITRTITLKSMIIGFFIISVPLLMLSIIIKGSMGGGDIKLMAVSGAFLGYRNIIMGFFIASIVSSTILIVLLLLKKINAKDTVPYGPFLSIGIFIASLYS